MLHVYPFSPSNPLLLYPMVVGVLKAVLYFIAFSGVSSTPRHHHSSNPQNQPARDNRYRYHWPKLHRDGDLTFLPVGHLNLCCVFFPDPILTAILVICHGLLLRYNSEIQWRKKKADYWWMIYNYSNFLW